MNKKIIFVTTNKYKVEEANRLGVDYSIEFIQNDYDYPELRSDDTKEIAIQGAKLAYARVGKPIIVEDSGLFVDALYDFPGTCSAYIFKRIGFDGILRLMMGVENRSAKMVSCIAYCEGKEVKTFYGAVEGNISEKLAGKFGFGFDPIFIPHGYEKTFAEDQKVKSELSHRAKAFKKFCEWYQDGHKE